MLHVPVNSRFDGIADNYRVSGIHSDSPSLHWLAERAASLNPQHVADLACGAGHAAAAAAKTSVTVSGIDPSPRMLSHFSSLVSASMSAEVNTIEAFAENIPLPSGSFDLIVCRLAAHHFHDIGAALREARRLLQEGGSLLMVDLQGYDDDHLDRLNHQIEVLHDPTHIRSYTLDRWTLQLEHAGFRIIEKAGGIEERDGGITLSKWCDIAQSGTAAQAAIHTMFDRISDQHRDAIGVTFRDGEYFVPVRTCLIHAVA